MTLTYMYSWLVNPGTVHRQMLLCAAHHGQGSHLSTLLGLVLSSTIVPQSLRKKIAINYQPTTFEALATTVATCRGPMLIRPLSRPPDNFSAGLTQMRLKFGLASIFSAGCRLK